MKQPDLGKRIAELRKAKGLTQDELVQKCNLNVRTLQRIESGEVTPRSYTIKIIFAALDFNIYDSSKSISNKFINMGLITSHWLEQLYKYVVDLFNLKTNTMKKISILTSTFLIIGFGLFALCSESKAQNKNKNKMPAWQSKFIETDARGINYFFPREIKAYNLGKMQHDTASFDFGSDLVQVYQDKIFLNKKYVRTAHIGDSVILHRGFIDVRNPYYSEFISPNGKGIIYITPKDLPVVNYGVNRDTDWMFAGKYQIREVDNKIFLNGRYCGIANKGDSVILKKGSFFTRSSLCIKKGL
jgi:transcriptional regulator with XRE-family HTH domain